MWANESVFYQIYPLGFCGAPFENDGVTINRIHKVNEWIPHLKKLGINAVYFGPVFSSDTHGYNTRDYRQIDCRLGNNEDFKIVCDALHQEGIKIVLDGVFNHVGRGFFAFQDVMHNKEQSRYRDWFYLNMEGNSAYQDGFYYEGWEGNYDLVKLNLNNEEVVQYLLESVRYWISYFNIEGIRLDVAYCLNRDFMRRLRAFTDERKDDFFLVGEMIHGDYNELLKPDMLHSVTNYECYKGLYSSFNSMNLFEINHSLQRQFGQEQGQGIYKGSYLLSFVDNHDVTRVADILSNEAHLPLIYALLFAMPGIPCIYYGSEWGARGKKNDGDQALRLSYDKPVENALSSYISTLIKIRKSNPALQYGSFRTVYLTNEQCVIERKYEEERILIAVNAKDTECDLYFDMGTEKWKNLLREEIEENKGKITMKPYSVEFYLSQS